jgi:membrane fusion protein (multidrug efflux system)
MVMNRRHWIASFLLIAMVIASGAGLAAWKQGSLQESAAASSHQPEAMESVTISVVKAVEHSQTATSIGTVLALRSITLRNELAGTVSQVRFTPGQIVEAGTVLVALDVSVEEADLHAQQAQAVLARTVLDRRRALTQDLAAAQEEVDRAHADLDVAQAQIARTKALIARKTIRAPFRARVGLADVHPGQYLNEGTQLTTLQGIDEAVHVDFAVPQHVAIGLRPGASVDVFIAGEASPLVAKIVALDARIDPATRNTMVRARIDGSPGMPAPGAAVRIRVPVGVPRKAVAIPVNALRKGPGGDQVFVIEEDREGKQRAHMRQVESGAMLGDDIVIHTGLTAGERVAASGAFKLRDGVLVVSAREPEGGPGQDHLLSRR